MKTTSAFLIFFAVACASAPRPTAGMLERERNPRATAEGRVIDASGKPVAGIQVQAIPRGKDIPWSPPATTDADGRFTLRLVAPGSYGFVLTEGDTTVVTDDPRDPSHVVIEVAPGDRRSGIELLLLREERKRILEDR